MLDTLALAVRLQNVHHTLAYTPATALSYFQDLVPDGFKLMPQRGADLGERLSIALAHHFELGYRRVVIMNSDGPTLPLDYLKEAFSALAHADITLGMGHDGGYYLIGMKRLQPTLFENISWSTQGVIPQTIALCDSLGLTAHKLPEWYDVDVEADLDRLRHDLAQNPASAPRTYSFLHPLGETS
jgi:rSAM/selenodomain-associated transferase 1